MAGSPFTINPVQTALTISFRNERLQLIADEILPRVPVGASKFSWNYMPVAQGYTVPKTEVGRRGRLERVEFTGEQRTSEIKFYGLEDSIPNQDIKDAEAMRSHGLGTFDPVNTSTEMLTDLILIDREARVAGMIQDPQNYSPQNRVVLSGGSQLSNPNSDVISTIKAALDKPLLLRPNTATMGREVWGAISSHPQLVNAVKGNVSSKGIIKPDDFVELFRGEGLKKLYIGEAFINTARPGQVPSLSRIWGKHISLTYINPTARPEYGATFGMTAQWGTRVAGSFEDKNIGLDGGMVVRVGERVREIITAPEAGYLIQNAVG